MRYTLRPASLRYAKICTSVVPETGLAVGLHKHHHSLTRTGLQLMPYSDIVVRKKVDEATLPGSSDPHDSDDNVVRTASY